MDAAFFRDWMTAAAAVVETQRDHLTQLDAAIGDADHGINMARGFGAVTAALEQKDTPTPGSVLTLAGSTLISKVGGASGPLYGMALRSAGKALGDTSDADLPALAGALEAALAGVQKLGAAREGEKTMVDALAPAVSALAKALAERAPSPRSPAPSPPSRCRRSRVGPVTSAPAASGTRTPARRRWR